MISRRDMLKSLTMGASATSVLKMIPLQAAEHAHAMLREEKAKAAGAPYTPKFFPAHQYETVCALCQMIVPADSECGGAIQAGAPEFIDLLTSENADYQLTLGGGIAWLDATCTDRYGKLFLECPPATQKEILDLIAYRANAAKDAALGPGVKFFAFLRNLTLDGFLTSEIGFKYLQYIGNTYLAEFPGCPPLPPT